MGYSGIPIAASLKNWRFENTNDCNTPGYVRGDVYECETCDDGTTLTIPYEYYLNYGSHYLFKTYSKQYIIAYKSEMK